MQDAWRVGRYGAALVLLALSVRAVAAVAVDRVVSATPGRLCLIEGDADGYWQLAGRLANGQPFEIYQPPRRVLRMVGFPAVLAVSRTLFGDQVWPARCVLVVIGAATCGCVFWLGYRLCGFPTAVLATLGAALSPTLIVFSPLLLSETTFALAMTASLIPLVGLLRPPPSGRRSTPAGGRTPPGTLSTRSVAVESLPMSSRSDSLPRMDWLRAVLAGLLAGLATHVRPTWILVPPWLALAVVWRRGRDTAAWGEAAVLLLTFAATLAPWALRNHQVTGHWVLTTLWDGPSLYDGLHPQATGESDMRFFDEENLLSRMSEYDMNREYRRRAWEFVAADPVRTLELGVIKAQRYWSLVPNTPQFSQPVVQALLVLATLPLFVGAVLGGWFGRRDVVLLLLTAGPILLFAAVHVLFVASLRYRLPAEPALWVLAAHGWLGWWCPRSCPTGPSASNGADSADGSAETGSEKTRFAETSSAEREQSAPGGSLPIPPGVI